MHHTQPRKTAWGARVLLQKLVRRARQTGRRIVLVMDQGNPHHAKALHRDLELFKDHVEVFWLPHYSPDLNLIERLWKHLKESRVANVLFRSFRQFVRHIEHILQQFAQSPDLTFGILEVDPNQRIRKQLLVGT